MKLKYLPLVELIRPCGPDQVVSAELFSAIQVTIYVSFTYRSASVTFGDNLKPQDTIPVKKRRKNYCLIRKQRKRKNIYIRCNNSTRLHLIFYFYLKICFSNLSKIIYHLYINVCSKKI